jgi:hypothetical protein
MAQMIPLPEDSPTVDVRLAGKALGISSTTSYNRAATGELAPGIPVIKIGGKYRVSTAVLRRALGLEVVAS